MSQTDLNLSIVTLCEVDFTKYILQNPEIKRKKLIYHIVVEISQLKNKNKGKL